MDGWALQTTRTLSLVALVALVVGARTGSDDPAALASSPSLRPLLVIAAV
jgi:hypothetical protein